MTQHIDHQTPPPRDHRVRSSFIFMLAGVAALLAAGVLFFMHFTSEDARFASGPGTAIGFGPDFDYYLTPEPTPEGQPAADVAPTPSGPAGPPPSEAPAAQLVIPRFGVNGPLITLGLDENGVMEAPDGPWDVGWYDFSARPGFGGNSVFAGHVDWYNIGPGGGPGGAVFWDLRNLEEGDLIEVRLQDGTVYQYRMTSRQQIDPATADIASIVGPTEREVITLITCGGSFDSESRHYNERVVVRAERITESPASASAP